MPPGCQDANIRERRRRKTRNKTVATTPTMSAASAPAKTTSMNSPKTINTRPTIKTISKKKKVNKRRGKWRITPANDLDHDSVVNTAKTLATSLAKNNSAKYSTKTHAKILWKAFNIPSKTPVKFRAKSSFQIREKKNPSAARKLATKITSSANIEVQCADTATVSVMGLLFDGLGVLNRKRQNTRDISKQKDLFHSNTSEEKDSEEDVPVKKQKICIQDKDRSTGTTNTTDDVKDVEKEANRGKEVCEKRSNAVKANQEDLRLKKKENSKEKKKMQHNLSRISAYEYYQVANIQEKVVPNKKQKTFRQAKGRTGPTTTTINDTNQDGKEVKKVDVKKRHAMTNVLKEKKQQKKEKNRLKKKQQQNYSSIGLEENVPNYGMAKKQKSCMEAKDRPLIATSNTINEVQKEDTKAKEVLEKKGDTVKFNQEVKLNKREKKMAKRKKQQQQRRVAKIKLGKQMKKESSVNFYNSDGNKSKMSLEVIEKSKKRQIG